MYCSECGKKISSKSNFCKHCGFQIKKEKKINKDKNEYIWTCDFCGKESNTKKDSDTHELKCVNNPKYKKFPYVTSPKRIWAWVWFVTVIVFIANCYIAYEFSNLKIELFNGKFLLTLFFSNIATGIFAFIAIAFSNHLPKKKEVFKMMKYVIPLCLLYLIINPSIFALEGYRVKQSNEYKDKHYGSNIPTLTPIPTPENTSTPTSISKKTTQKTTTSSNSGSGNQNSVDCIGPDGKQFRTSMDECKKLNEKWGKPVDYIIDCGVSQNCGGGSRKLKLSECNNAVCCQIGSNWIFYLSKDKCDADQASNSKTNNQNIGSKKVAFTTNYATIKGTYYCSESAINQILNNAESDVKYNYEAMQQTCQPDLAQYMQISCKNYSEWYQKSKSKLDGYIKQFCP